jgi:hypothetical protein
MWQRIARQEGVQVQLWMQLPGIRLRRWVCKGQLCGVSEVFSLLTEVLLSLLLRLTAGWWQPRRR